MAEHTSVIGLSTLRENDKPAPKSEKALQLEAYLKRYQECGDSTGEKKKRKKKMKKAEPNRVQLHDEDVRWQDAKERSDGEGEDDIG